MYLGRVLGRCVATTVTPGLEGKKLLVVEPLDHRGEALRGPEVAVDMVQAGPGDLVYLVGSREASLALEPSFVPVDAAIVGVVDDVAAGGPPSGRPEPEPFEEDE
ncbi:MAG: ethanolamine utilization protein EutN [Deltaproteobacteria bacterium]|nr:MAG: ethanolamine utilization protein EutN [Deltaproteobacteria bacterium]